MPVGDRHVVSSPFSCSCCQAVSISQGPTCSNPLYYYSGESYSSCPFPPSVVVSDTVSTGPLEDVNVYVAEQLLSLGTNLSAAAFLQRFVGGFVLHRPNPVYSACGCQNANDSCEILRPALAGSDTFYPNCTLNPDVPSSACYDNSAVWNDDAYNGLIDACMGGNLSCGEYVYPPVTTCGHSSPMVGEVSQPAPATASELSATIWYNNEVSIVGVYLLFPSPSPFAITVLLLRCACAVLLLV